MNTVFVHSTIEKPILTHKSYKALEKNKYTFFVNKKSTKILVKQEIEETFNVKVKKINISNVLGKKKNYKQTIGKRSDKKKAIITLQQNYSIEEIKIEQN